MKKISMKHVRELKGSGEEVFFINVLPKEEYRKNHIPGSINIPLKGEEDFVQRVEKIVPSKNHKIVLYCENEKCQESEIAAKQLEEKGFSYVMDFTGGMQEWKEAGGNTRKHEKVLT